MANYWLLRAGERGRLWAEWAERSPPVVTIGWDIGGPSEVDFSDKSAVKRRVSRAYESDEGATAGQLRYFVGGRTTHMSPGDFVVILGDAAVEAVAQVGELAYNPSGLSSASTHTYQRPIEFVVKSASAGGVALRSLPKRFGRDANGHGEASLYDLSQTIQEYHVTRGEFTDLLECLSSRDDVIVARDPDELLESPSEREFYVALSEPVNFLTAYRRNVWGVRNTDNLRGTWADLEEGDIIFFRSHGKGETDKDWGLIGYGVVGDYKATKSEYWWRDEHVNEDVVYEHVFGFKETFCLGDQHVIQNRPEHRKSAEQLTIECEAILQNMLPVEDAADHLGWVSFNDINMWGPSQSNGRKLLEKLHAHDRERERSLIESSPEIDLSKEDVLADLHFPDELASSIVEDVTAALDAGKHVIFTGPPGTGKTEIAQNVGQALVDTHDEITGSKISTATADWSTFDTVGGHMPSATGSGELEFRPGLVLRRFKRNDEQKNEVLVIDEINRADIDKALGQLFTVFSGQEVQLPFEQDDREVCVLPAEQYTGTRELASNEYVMPRSWRLLATMNTYDKTSLYEMSYAFMRRFAFIRIPVPALPEGESGDAIDELERLMHAYVETWDLEWDRREAMAVARVWRTTNTTIDDRSIGPAIVKDLYQHVSRHANDSLSAALTQAVISYVFPQLEGVPKREQIVRQLASVDEIDERLLQTAARDMLQVTLTESEPV
ncbi:ATPase associated with various cellular activities AAA 5 [Natrialba hulunbeirensis JCM 10989]|uniref:ATPase associated with various cellular activities AAA 5 n=1 Tax=Natrialba hulunbeirensis JCM 10989 TaxID=1227493 RepID=L9ZU54_9EURY|nr:MoxR family ATPase [Natrialba hulunbeirensis]ELY88718.1 ATPase associated with various cellular activities AAA 5 [Natrialba hulunbeirensis JCM 10989]